MSLTNVTIDLTAEQTLETLRSEVARIVPAKLYYITFDGAPLSAESCTVWGHYTDASPACDENYAYTYAENVARFLTDLVELSH